MTTTTKSYGQPTSAQGTNLPCPLCGQNAVRLIWYGAGFGGQMLTVTPYATCDYCHTIYQDVAASTAGFSLAEAKRNYESLMRRIRA